jgi:hypothetical protein
LPSNPGVDSVVGGEDDVEVIEVAASDLASSLIGDVDTALGGFGYSSVIGWAPVVFIASAGTVDFNRDASLGGKVAEDALGGRRPADVSPTHHQNTQGLLGAHGAILDTVIARQPLCVDLRTVVVGLSTQTSSLV